MMNCVPEDFECPEGLFEGANEVFAGEYNVPSLTFERLGRPPVILDIGGNIGAFSRKARQDWPDAAIFAFEPHPGNAAIFRRNCPDVELREVAVINTKGQACPEVILYDGVDGSGQASLECRGGQVRDKTFTVKTLQATELPPADFLKIDTEGCELPVLYGYKHLDGVAAVALEFHYRADQFYIGAHLSYAGFQCVRQKVDSIDHRSGRHSGVLIFCRPEFMTLCVECHVGERRRGFQRADGQYECLECGDVFP